MICDDLKNWKRFVSASAFVKAFSFLENVNADTPDGTYELDGRNVYAMVQSYDTAPAGPAFFEVHRKYVDVQYTISGTEVIAWTHDTGSIPFKTPYDPAKEAGFLTIPENMEFSRLEMRPGMFVVFYPDDGHCGGLGSAAAGPSHVKKVCIKVALDAIARG